MGVDLRSQLGAAGGAALRNTGLGHHAKCIHRLLLCEKVKRRGGASNLADQKGSTVSLSERAEPSSVPLSQSCGSARASEL